MDGTSKPISGKKLFNTEVILYIYKNSIMIGIESTNVIVVFILDNLTLERSLTNVFFKRGFPFLKLSGKLCQNQHE